MYIYIHIQASMHKLIYIYKFMQTHTHVRQTFSTTCTFFLVKHIVCGMYICLHICIYSVCTPKQTYKCRALSIISLHVDECTDQHSTYMEVYIYLHACLFACTHTQTYVHTHRHMHKDRHITACIGTVSIHTLISIHIHIMCVCLYYPDCDIIYIYTRHMHAYKRITR